MSREGKLMAITYRIRFKQGDAEFEVEGDRNYVTKAYQEMKEILGLSQPAKPVLVAEGKPSKLVRLKTLAEKSPSPREFIDRYGLTRHVDIVLAFGYFLERVRSLKSFTGADINTCYYEAKVEPSNTSQMIINNIKKGLIMPSHKSGSKKSYTLTRTGEEFVIGGFKATKAK
jgi:predicted transcriptional regulator